MQKATEELSYSCLYNKISHYRRLNSEEESYLETLERDRHQWPARRRIRRAGDDTGNLYVVRHGWLYSTEQLSNDKRHVRGIFMPGDIIGLNDITMSHSICDLFTATKVELCTVPKKSLRKIFEEAPSISALFFAFAAIEGAVLAERLMAATRLEADARLAYFLLQLHARNQITAPECRNWLLLPLSQETIGDAVGLSQPYVNKVLNDLEADGLIAKKKNGFEFLDIEKLTEMAGFTNYYDLMDQRWMPESRF